MLTRTYQTKRIKQNALNRAHQKTGLRSVIRFFGFGVMKSISVVKSKRYAETVNYNLAAASVMACLRSCSLMRSNLRFSSRATCASSNTS